MGDAFSVPFILSRKDLLEKKKILKQIRVRLKILRVVLLLKTLSLTISKPKSLVDFV